MDFVGCLVYPGNSLLTERKFIGRTVNRHWWTGINVPRRGENDVEGTRQIASVTSGKGGLFFGQPLKSGTEMEVATVYQKHRAMLTRKRMYIA